MPDDPTITVQWASQTDKGRVREKNEDAWFVDEEIKLFLVSDGMGGHRGGEMASKIVTEDLPVFIETGLHELKSKSCRFVRSLLKKSIIKQSDHVLLEGAEGEGYKDMGATVAVLIFIGPRAYIANLGDSRIYRFRDNRLVQLSKDHSVIAELIEQGTIEPHEVPDHESHGQITNFIGMEEKAEPYVRSFAVKNNDRFLLCTDGLTDTLTKKQIALALRNEQEPNKLCDILINTANNQGGHDNTTVIIIDCVVK